MKPKLMVHFLQNIADVRSRFYPNTLNYLKPTEATISLNSNLFPGDINHK